MAITVRAHMHDQMDQAGILISNSLLIVIMATIF
jgi:hypothetical protein